MRWDELHPGLVVNGPETDPVTLLDVRWFGAAHAVITYRHHGQIREESLVEVDVHDWTVGAPNEGAFGGNPHLWKLGVESLRVKHASLLDPMQAVASSSLQPLPHQIDAVYGRMLPRPRLRFLLADDPGAGKTIMCGLYLKEQMLRGLVDRCLIVAPGSLVDQWLEELDTKFGLEFRKLTTSLVHETHGSVFDANPLLVASMDQLKGNEDLLTLARQSRWDLVVVDEAHRMSTKVTSRGDLDPTKRYDLGRLLSASTHHLLLMTATPHAGDQAAFQAFLALLDEDRFGVRAKRLPAAPPEDVMRRMLKEELLTLEGKPLFPERIARTVEFRLSGAERDLYDAVSDYVRHEMGRVERVKSEGNRRAATAVGFAMTVLQRRLASSPRAILRTLERRRERLRNTAEAGFTGGEPNLTSLEDEWAGDVGETEAVENQLVDGASAAQTHAELMVELEVLEQLVELADQVHAAGNDTKWSELRTLLESGAEVHGPEGSPRKIIIFSEHRDTLDYLTSRIETLSERAGGVVQIHGGMPHHERRAVQARFSEDPGTTVLVATDAAGEGLNLQAAHLMVNYDLPWNPNRLDQRFGRIHRIGQENVCHLWNMVAADTREGDVYLRLFEKIEAQSAAYRGKVFDVLGEAFVNTSLRDLLEEAIEYGDRPEVLARRDAVLDETLSREVPRLLAERAMYNEVLKHVDVVQARQDIEAARPQRLQPHHLQVWFAAALDALGGRSRSVRNRPMKVAAVPEAVRERVRERSGVALPHQLGQVCFDGSAEEPNVRRVTAGDALTSALAEEVSATSLSALGAGAVLVDDHASEPSLLAVVEHSVHDGGADARELSRTVRFLRFTAPDHAEECLTGHLDLRSPNDAERAAASAECWGQDPENVVMSWAMENVVSGHVENVRATVVHDARRAHSAISDRLEALRDSATLTSDDEALVRRLEHRLVQLDQQSQLRSQPPRVITTAWVLPGAGLVADAPSLPPHLVDEVVAQEVVQGREVIDRVRFHGVVQLHSKDYQGRMRRVEIRSLDSAEWLVPHTHVVAGKNLGQDHHLVMVKQSHNGAEMRRVVAPFADVALPRFDESTVLVRCSGLWTKGRG